MHLRLAVLAAVCAAVYGCATPPDEPKAGAPDSASAPQPRQGSYRTGSRLRSYEEKGGASSVGDVSKDDYADEVRRTISPIRGQ